MVSAERIGDLTLEQLRAIIREEMIGRGLAVPVTPSRALRLADLSDFPVDSYGSWPEDLSLRRQGMYGDDER
jgi:hypothetical protein